MKKKTFPALGLIVAAFLFLIPLNVGAAAPDGPVLLLPHPHINVVKDLVGLTERGMLDVPGLRVVFVSDGVLNAGIGGAYPLGWGWELAAGYLEKHAHRGLSAEELADKVADAVSELYLGRPGDDVSIVVIKVRHKQVATVFTGPPGRREADGELAHRFVSRTGRLVVCGGTTAKIVAKHLGQPLEVDLSTITADVPPIARLEGVDLVTEGILTLTQVRDMLRKGEDRRAVQYRNDGAACLLRLLLEVDHTHFIVGQAMNPAHQNPDLPHQLGIRAAVVREIAAELRSIGKEVTLEVI